VALLIRSEGATMSAAHIGSCGTRPACSPRPQARIGSCCRRHNVERKYGPSAVTSTRRWKESRGDEPISGTPA